MGTSTDPMGMASTAAGERDAIIWMIAYLREAADRSAMTQVSNLLDEALFAAFVETAALPASIRQNRLGRAGARGGK
jgi:hypothetical protein